LMVSRRGLLAPMSEEGLLVAIKQMETAPEKNAHTGYGIGPPPRPRIFCGKI